MGTAEPGNRLIGWKAIGQFLRCTERTARRWETDRALPVHRVPGGGRSQVWAHPDELTQWLRELRSDGPGELASELAPEPASPADNEPAANEPGDHAAVVAPIEPPPRRDEPAVPESSLALHPLRWNARMSSIALLVLMLVLSAGLIIWNLPRLSGRTTSAKRTPYDGNLEDAASYSTARFELSTRTAEGLNAAERDFRDLVERYPRQAAGWSGLADTYLLLREFGGLSDAAAYPKAAEAARNAIALDPSSADAWRDQAFVEFWWQGEFGAAFRAFDRAIELAPTSAKAFHWYGTALLERGEFDKSLKMMARARALDPNDRAIVADEGWMRFIAGQRKEGLASLERMEQIDPSFVSSHTYLARAYLILGRDAEFLREAHAAAALRGQTDSLARLALADQQFQAGGRVALLDQLTASETDAFNRGQGSAITLALYRALAHDEAGMYHWIAVAEAQHDHLLASLRVDPEFSDYRAQPRFQAALQRLP